MKTVLEIMKLVSSEPPLAWCDDGVPLGHLSCNDASKAVRRKNDIVVWKVRVSKPWNNVTYLLAYLQQTTLDRRTRSVIADSGFSPARDAFVTSLKSAAI